MLSYAKIGIPPSMENPNKTNLNILGTIYQELHRKQYVNGNGYKYGILFPEFDGKNFGSHILVFAKDLKELQNHIEGDKKSLLFKIIRDDCMGMRMYKTLTEDEINSQTEFQINYRVHMHLDATSRDNVQKTMQNIEANKITIHKGSKADTIKSHMQRGTVLDDIVLALRAKAKKDYGYFKIHSKSSQSKMYVKIHSKKKEKLSLDWNKFNNYGLSRENALPTLKGVF